MTTICSIPFAGYHEIQGGELIRLEKTDPKVLAAIKSGELTFYKSRAAAMQPPAPKAPASDENLRELLNHILARVSTEGQTADLREEKHTKRFDNIEQMMKDIGVQVKTATDEVGERDKLLKELAAKVKLAPAAAPVAPAPAAAVIPPPPGPARPVSAVVTLPTPPQPTIVPFRQRARTVILWGLSVTAVVLLFVVPSYMSSPWSNNPQVAKQSDKVAEQPQVPPAPVPAVDSGTKEQVAVLTKDVNQLKKNVGELAEKVGKEAPQAQPAPPPAPAPVPPKREAEKQSASESKVAIAPPVHDSRCSVEGTVFVNQLGRCVVKLQ